jgi:hypothetical protein
LKAVVTVKKRKGISKQRAFLASYVATASITKAAKAAKIDRSLHYRWLLEDEDYKKAFSAAQSEAGDLLEDEAVRRAHQGVRKPLVYQGQFTYAQRLNKETGALENYGQPLAVLEYSDPLMMFLLRGFKSDKYRDRGSMEVSGPAGGPIALEDARLKKLTDEELAGLIALAAKLETE